ANRAFSESQAIDFAFVSALLKHFCQCETMHLTVRGRLSSGNFELRLPSSAGIIDVSNVQIEVDAGYENDDQIVLVEAKIGRRSDFHIRQVIYPYMQWSQKTKKKIRPIFLTYSNGQYVLTEFAVGETYGALEIVSNRAFIVNDSEVALINVAELMQAQPLLIEPVEIPFPQANDMDKVVDTIQLIDQGVNTKSALAEFFEFDERQAYYYSDAARYLGFVEKEKQVFVLTEAGREFLTLAARTQRTKAIFRQMLKRPSLRGAISLLAERQFDLTSVKEAELAAIIQQNTALTGSTPLRRANTLRKWFKWLLNNSVLK
ncbi:MAG: AAA-associated domain-containing protein, partial [Cyanobacteria bacterium REEB67]|nr:AAA-associated domain-containing protein [Cyanobacteria bacterium REEB67]